MDGMHPQELPPPAIILQVLLSKQVVFSLRALAELEVADHMSFEPASVESIAAASGTDAGALHRILRALASVGLFVEHPGNMYALTPATQLIRKDVPDSLRDLVIMFMDKWQVESFERTAYSLKTGKDATTHVFGKHTFDLFRDIPDQAANFHRAMTSFSSGITRAVVAAKSFPEFRRMADVGGGHGVVLSTILRANPGLTGVVFDLPEVVAGIEPGAYDDLGDRFSAEGGSFFERVPAGCDAYIMKHIIHDWDDGSCRRILSLMREQLAATAPETGRVFLFEMVVPDAPGPAPAKLLDIEMLVVTPGGKERTGAEFSELFASAGLRLLSITPTHSPICILEAAVA